MRGSGESSTSAGIIYGTCYSSRGLKTCCFHTRPLHSSLPCCCFFLLITEPTVEGKIYTSSNMDPSQVDIPPLKDLTIDNITENVHMINSRCPDPRLKYLLERLVSHVHDFARETRLSTNEWMAAIQFLTQVGQICTDVRQVRTQPILDFPTESH